MKFHFANYWNNRNIDYNEFHFFKPDSQRIAYQSFEKYDIWVYCGKRFLLLKKRFKEHDYIPETDYLITKKNTIKDISMIQKLHFKKWVIDASNKKSYSLLSQKQADSLKIDCHSIFAKGAWIENISK
jgi:hypothetical protein